jgi:CDP-paratose 2-epimerase
LAREARTLKILIAGSCGFVGLTLARAWHEEACGHELIGTDSLIRPGSETNRRELQGLGVRFIHSDLRSPSDFDSWPAVDAVIEAAANPSVLAGVDGVTSSRQLIEHNLIGTINTLEYCRRTGAAFVLLSTSRVYSILALNNIALEVRDDAFTPAQQHSPVRGLTREGITESFSTTPPLSLYGASKLASEQLALEYGAAYGFPVWVNRCGVLAGAGQFGRPDQGIYTYWLHSWLYDRPLRYIGFSGEGFQVRDCLHPADLRLIIDRQLAAGEGHGLPRVVNLGGGLGSALSLRQLSHWCEERLGSRAVQPAAESRPFDIPWLVLDSSLAQQTWGWAPRRATSSILDEILAHAQAHPEWLALSALDKV